MLKIQKNSSRPVRLDSNPDEIISTLCLATDGLFRNSSRMGKGGGRLILVVPVFVPNREGGTQEKDLVHLF